MSGVETSEEPANSTVDIGVWLMNACVRVTVPLWTETRQTRGVGEQ